MLGIYFSGTGNTKYCVETFLNEFDKKAIALPIEHEKINQFIQNSDDIVFGYSVQYSCLPKMVYDFIVMNKSLWRGKRIFVIATMGLFSGDGATITGGLHIKMPDSICDEKVLKRTYEINCKTVDKAKKKIELTVANIKDNKIPQDGLHFFNHLMGLFGQRLYFASKTKKYATHLKIDHEQCVKCGKCIKLCPMKNLKLENCIITTNNKCTLCYRCINYCPKQAITLLGKKVIEQSIIEKYI